MSLDGRLETKKDKTSFEKNVERPVSGTNSFFDSAFLMFYFKWFQIRSSHA